MIPPEPEPDPPTPVTPKYTFQITNGVSNSVKFALAYIDKDGSKYGQNIETSGLITSGNSVEFVFEGDLPESASAGPINFAIAYSTTSSAPSTLLQWNTIGRTIVATDLVGKTFKGVYGGSQTANTWVIE